MPLVYAAVTPHAPVLAPTLAIEHQNIVEQTVAALTHIGQELRANQVETIIVLTPHASGDAHTFFASSDHEFQVDLSAFGDYKTNYRALHNWIMPSAFRGWPERGQRSPAYPSLPMGNLMNSSIDLVNFLARCVTNRQRERQLSPQRTYNNVRLGTVNQIVPCPGSGKLPLPSVKDNEIIFRRQQMTIHAVARQLSHYSQPSPRYNPLEPYYHFKRHSVSATWWRNVIFDDNGY